MSTERSVWTGLGVFVSAFVVTAYPPAVALHHDGVVAAFRAFASDAFYYLTIAHQSAGRAVFTFDGEHATSGFHPLWEWILAFAFANFELDDEGRLLFVAATSIVLVSIGSGLLAWVTWRLTQRPLLSLVGVAPGAYAIVVPRFDGHSFAPWSFANGMETPLSMALFGILLVGLFGRGWLREDRSLGSLVLVSAVLSAIVLSRLDDIFIFVPFLIWAIYCEGSPFVPGSARRVVRRLTALSLVPVLTIGAYLAYNLIQTGGLLPSSGTAKAQPLWALGRNLYALWMMVLPFADPLGRGPITWTGEAWRVLQMVVPAVGAAVWLLVVPSAKDPSRKDATRREDRLLGLLAVYVLCKAAYNFSMVGLWHQGQWYYPLSIMSFNCFCAVGLGRVLDRLARDDAAFARPLASEAPIARFRVRWPLVDRLGRGFPIVAAVIFILVRANGFVEEVRSEANQQRNYTFWLEREATRAQLERTCPGCGLLEFDDGIVAYSLPGTSTLNGLGLVMDRAARQARQSGQLLELAYERGHRIFASVHYQMPYEAYWDPARLREALARNAHFANQDLDAWEFEAVFASTPLRVVFVKFERRVPVDRPTPKSRLSYAPVRRE